MADGEVGSRREGKKGNELEGGGERVTHCFVLLFLDVAYEDCTGVHQRGAFISINSLSQIFSE